MPGHFAADLRLCFCIAKSRFSHDTFYIIIFRNFRTTRDFTAEFKPSEDADGNVSRKGSDQTGECTVCSDLFVRKLIQ